MKGGSILATLATVLSAVPCFAQTIAVSPDGKHVAASDSGNVHVWRQADGKRVCVVDGHAVAFYPDGSAIVTGSGKTVKVWSLSGKTKFTCEEHRDKVFFLAISRDGKKIVSSDLNQTMIWDAASGRRLSSIDVTTKAVFFGGDGEAILITSLSRVCSEKGEELRRLENPKGYVHTRYHVVTPDNKRLFAAVGDGLFSWDLSTGRRIGGHRFDREIRAMAVSADGKRLVVSAGRKTHVLDISDLAVWPTKSQTSSVGQSVEGLAFSTDGKYFLTNEICRPVRVWDVSSGEGIDGKHLEKE